MRRALFLASLVAALATQWLVARGQDRARDLPAIAVSHASRESAGYVTAFNGRDSKALAALFTSDASISFLQGSSVEKLDYGIVDGRGDIVGAHGTFFSNFPDARLTQTVLVSAHGSAVGSGLATGMFLTTLSFLVTTPGWEPSLGGFPALSAMPGQSLLKDVVLLGVALSSAGEALEAVRRRGALVAATTQGAVHNDPG